MSTKELLNFLKSSQNAWLELSLISGNLRCTHFINFTKNEIRNIGIDSQESKMTEKEFLTFYQKAKWQLQ